MAVQLFNKTSRLTQAVELVNGLDDSKFPLLLSRILQKIHLKDEETFTPEEESKLQVSLSLDKLELKFVLECLSFILEQAAYHLAKPNVLSQQLKQLKMNEKKVSAVVDAWTNNAKEVTKKLRERTLAPKELSSVSWELHMELAQSNLIKQKRLLGLIELGLTPETEDKIQIQFDHKQLFSFYKQLETIQSQLDSLH
ncbi:COMM domain-containing protein 10-like [Limulus polyphemus]|uniref:COMM domain-containing protein 10-like n=1 Tax=Limulus polyphemus TaxID=6850 RepID=A0ABM1BUR1_LIMPO|nr:COMM domain-containing protein 10-like [Limulus polyphemus]